MNAKKSTESTPTIYSPTIGLLKNKTTEEDRGDDSRHSKSPTYRITMKTSTDELSKITNELRKEHTQ